MTWWVIANPRAGRGRHSPERVAALLAGMGIDASVHASRDGEHVAELVAEGIGLGHDRFVAVGGDGTVNLVVNALLKHDWPADKPVLGILPAGSGCDFVRTFGISQKLEEAAKHLEGDETYLVDVARVSGSWGDRHFLNVATIGLGADVVRLADRLPARLGSARYKLAIWPTLVRFPRTTIELETDKRGYTGPAMMVVLANAQFFGGGMNVAPKAMLVDGRLDVQIFSGPKRLAVTLQRRITRGTHLSHPAVRRLTASSFRLSPAAPWPVEVDGEYLGVGPVHGEVIPGALRIKI